MKEGEKEDRVEYDLESAIGLALRYGVVLSSALIAVGLVLSSFKVGSFAGFPPTLEGVISTGYGKPVYSMGTLGAQLGKFEPLSIIEAGVLVLLAIPFFRVAVGGIMFVAEKNWKYVAISALVLAVLLVGTFIVGPIEAR